MKFLLVKKKTKQKKNCFSVFFFSVGRLSVVLMLVCVVSRDIP